MKTTVAGSKFTISRVDGRSNQQVAIDLVKHSEPGVVHTYEEFREALSVGTERQFSLHDVQSVVRAAGLRLLREHQRALVTLKGVGYRVAHANEHSGLSLIRRRKSDVQQRHGFALLQHVRWDEMDPNVRKLAEGQLMVMGAMYQQQRAMEKRLTDVERALREIRGV